MRLEAVVAVAVPLLIILLTHTTATAGEVDGGTGSCRNLASSRGVLDPRWTHDCQGGGEEDDVSDRGSRKASGSDKWRGEQTTGRGDERGEKEDTGRKLEGKDARKGKERGEKNVKERESGGKRGKQRGEVRQLKHRDDGKRERNDKHREKERQKRKQSDEQTRLDDSKFHKKNKKNRNDKYEKRQKHKKDEMNKNYEHEHGHKYHKKHKKNKNMEHKQTNKHPKKKYDKSGRDKGEREEEEERRDTITPKDHKKQRLNDDDDDEKVNIDGKKLKENVSQKADGVTKENGEEDLACSVAEEQGTDVTEEATEGNAAKKKLDGMCVGIEESDEHDTVYENMTLGEHDDNENSVNGRGNAGEYEGLVENTDNGEGDERDYDGVGEDVKPHFRVSVGDGMVGGPGFDFLELLEAETMTEPESHVKLTTLGPKVPQTPDHEATTVGKDDQKGREEENEKADKEEKEERISRCTREEEIEPDGRGEEKGEVEKVEIEVGDQVGETDDDDDDGVLSLLDDDGKSQ